MDVPWSVGTRIAFEPELLELIELLQLGYVATMGYLVEGNVQNFKLQIVSFCDAKKKGIVRWARGYSCENIRH